jgi:hypothetical protein
MSRLLVVSFLQYRTYQLELRDSGGRECAVVIHPPARKGEPHEVPREGAPVTLTELIARAKALIDGVLGPRPPPRQLGQRGRMTNERLRT